MAKKIIKVSGHKRYDPRIKKKVDVHEYNRNQKISKYRNTSKTKSNLPSKPIGAKMHSENLGMLEFEVLEQIKLTLDLDADSITLDNLYDAFEDDQEDLEDSLQSLYKKGLVDEKYNLTADGHRVFWEWVIKNGELGDYEDLSDYPEDIDLMLEIRDDLYNQKADSYKRTKPEVQKEINLKIKKIEKDIVNIIGEPVYDDEDDIKIGNIEVKNLERHSVWHSDKFEDDETLAEKIFEHDKDFEYFGELWENGKNTGEFVEIWANDKDEMIMELMKQVNWKI